MSITAGNDKISMLLSELREMKADINTRLTSIEDKHIDDINELELIIDEKLDKILSSLDTIKKVIS